MKNRRNLVFLIIAPLVTLILLGCHKLLPIRSVAIIADGKGEAHLYADNSSGGRSEAIWLNEKTHAWQCRLRTGTDFPFCGMSTLPTGNHIKGLDLADMDAIRLHIGYSGPAKKIRFYIRNFSNNITSSDELDAGKFMFVQLNTSDLEDEITLNLSEFSVADWWIDRYDVPRARARPEFGNVVNIGIDFAHPYPYGDHIIAVRNIGFQGEWISAENWYLLIIALWITAFITYASFRWYQFYRHALKNSRRIAELATYNAQLQTKKEEYKYLSKIDALTGALNRFGFTQAVENVLDNRQTGEPISLVLFSIDHFKRVKDTMGLNDTDAFLQKVASLIADNSRTNHIISRWEGEEFILLCPDTVGSSAYILADQIRKSLVAAAFNRRGASSITISAGVAEIDANEGFASAFKKIDDALFKARSLGGNCIIMG